MINFIKEIFNKRTCYDFSDRDISDDLLKEIYDVAILGSTSANTCPLRILFIKSEEAKKKLIDCLAPGNKEKSQNSPIIAIFAYDLAFYKHMDILFSHNPSMKLLFENNKNLSFDTAYRNSTLQAAYFMIIAKAYGLDCGPMSGFDTDMVNREFFTNDENIRVNFICNLGYKNKDNPFPRSERLEFSKACKFQ
jgi:3-hydroxypropanoate dehydrogenase